MATKKTKAQLPASTAEALNQTETLAPGAAPVDGAPAEVTAVVVKEEARNPAMLETNGDAPTDEAWGSEGLDANDIVIPKYLLMQGLSKFVTDGDAAQGQIVDSLSREVVGGITSIKTKAGDPLEVIAFDSFKTWLEFEKREGEWVYLKQYPRNANNAHFAREEIVNGIEVRRDECLSFYVLNVKALAEQEAMPYVISFRRTSMRAGKKIGTIAAKLKAFGNKPLAYKHLLLSVVSLQKDDKSFWGYEVAEGEKSTQSELNEAYRWHKALKASLVRVDDSDLQNEKVNPDAEVQDAAPASDPHSY